MSLYFFSNIVFDRGFLVFRPMTEFRYWRFSVSLLGITTVYYYSIFGSLTPVSTWLPPFLIISLEISAFIISFYFDCFCTIPPTPKWSRLLFWPSTLLLAIYLWAYWVILFILTLLFICISSKLKSYRELAIKWYLHLLTFCPSSSFYQCILICNWELLGHPHVFELAWLL